MCRFQRLTFANRHSGQRAVMTSASSGPRTYGAIEYDASIAASAWSAGGTGGGNALGSRDTKAGGDGRVGGRRGRPVDVEHLDGQLRVTHGHRTRPPQLLPVVPCGDARGV